MRMEHVFREANVVADKLSKLGLDALPGLHVYDFAPPACNLPLSEDIQRTSFPRVRSSAGVHFYPP